MEYSFHLFNATATDGITVAVDKFLSQNPLYDGLMPVVVCIGSDLVIGDSLGPVVGSMLRYKTQGLGCFIYGTLSSPVTAKEIKYVRKLVKETHVSRPVIAIDAAVGADGDTGLIKVSDTPLLPGTGANKKLGSIGNLSIMGIVSEKSLGDYGLFKNTRLNLVYSMAEKISDALSSILWEKSQKRRII